MSSNKFLFLSILLLLNGILNYAIESNEENNPSLPNLNQNFDLKNELARYLFENENFLNDDSSVEFEEDDRFLIKKSAPRRIFIGKRLIPDYLNKKKSFPSLSPILSDFFAKRAGQINRIFIGKRGDI